MTASSQPRNVTERARQLEMELSKLGKRTYLALNYRTHSLLPGQLSSHHRTDRGIDLDVPRTFRLEDDPVNLDTSNIGVALQPRPGISLPPLICAAAEEKLRLRQAVLQSEAEMVVVIDCSRSMLTGCFQADDDLKNRVARTKLAAFYFAVGTLLMLGESSRLILRALFVHGGIHGRGAVDEERTRSPNHFAHFCLRKVSRLLTRSFEQAESSPGTEPFTLARGFAAALERRTRCIVVVISDFLDPLDDKVEGYRRSLIELMARRKVVFVDVAHELDRFFPVPGLWDFDARHTQVREWARHLEQGAHPCAITPTHVRQWNWDRTRDFHEFHQLVRAGGGAWLPFPHHDGRFGKFRAQAEFRLKKLR